MGNELLPAVAGLIPPGLTKSMRWRLTVSAFVCGLIVATAWGMGAFTALGAPGYARAEEVHLLDLRLSTIENNQRTGLRIALAGEICRIHFARMGTTGEVSRQLNKSFEDRQVEYSAVEPNHQRYNTGECSAPK